MSDKTKKLWQKSGSALNPAVTDYIISQNLEADNKLLPFDVQGSIAHARMLGNVGLLEKDDVKAIIAALEEIKTKHAAGDFILHQENEDVHTEIENYLVEKLGPVGKRVHVGRSRNDQVLTDMRLYSRSEIRETQELVVSVASTILGWAQKHEFSPLPGFTHMQHAMPSSMGQWAGSFVESLINDYEMLQSAYYQNDQNPLGSGSGFGSAVPLDREQTTKELGFSRVQINPLYCQNSRGRMEAYTITCLLQVMFTLGQLANDLVIFYSQEFGFVKIDRSLTTGSSMMPQKRNLDVMEVVRANVSVVQSLQIQCQTVGMNLISGYNKDLKITKKPLMDSFEIVQKSLNIVDLLFNNLEPDEENLKRAFDDIEIFATDYANDLVMDGKSFRDAYREIGENLDTLEMQDVYANIKGKKHIGATGNLCLGEYKTRLKELAAQRNAKKITI